MRPCKRHQSGRKGLLIAARWRRRHSCRSWEAGKANKRQNGSWNRHGASGREAKRIGQRRGLGIWGNSKNGRRARLSKWVFRMRWIGGQ